MGKGRGKRRRYRNARQHSYAWRGLRVAPESVFSSAPCPRGLRAVFSAASARWWLAGMALFALALTAGVCALAPVKADVILYKLSLPLVAAVLCWLLDRALWPYAAPSSYLVRDWRRDPDADGGVLPDFPVASGHHMAFCAAMLRQGLIVVGGMLAVSLGL